MNPHAALKRSIRVHLKQDVMKPQKPMAMLQDGGHSELILLVTGITM